MDDKENKIEFCRKTEQAGKKVSGNLMFGQLEEFDLCEWKETLVKIGLSSKVKERLTADMEELAHWSGIVVPRMWMIWPTIVLNVVIFIGLVILLANGIYLISESTSLLLLADIFITLWVGRPYVKLTFKWLDFWRHYAGALENVLTGKAGD